MFIGLYVEYLLLFLSDFNETLNFLDRISKNNEIPNVMKIRPVGAEFHVGGQTDIL
jgi:hypothetical protein